MLRLGRWVSVLPAALSVLYLAIPARASAQAQPFAPGGVQVTPDGGTDSQVRGTNNVLEGFTVKNTGTTTATFTYSATVTGGLTLVSVLPSSSSIAAGDTREVDVKINVGSTGGVVTLTASGSGSDQGTITVTALTPSVAVTPDAGPAAAKPTNTSGYGETFTVTNTGQVRDAYTISCSGASNLTCSGTSLATAYLAPGASTTVTANYSVGAAGTGTLTLTATGSYASDVGTYTMSVVTPTPQAPGVVTSTVNPGAVVARNLCLTIAMGPAAAAECGDLRVVHGLPTTRTMNKARTPTLIYNSAFAHPIPVVRANVTIPLTATLPTRVDAKLWNCPQVTGCSTVLATGTWNISDWGTPGKVRRIALSYDALAAGQTSGIYTQTLEVISVYASSSLSATQTIQTSIVNRSQSPFGAGWWLAGLEQINPATMVWTGGDGSIRQYTVVGPDAAVAPSVDHPDTLRLGADIHAPDFGYWTRHLPGGVRVLFDPATGRHVATRNRQGHTTSFGYTNGRLTSITLPSGTGSRVYQISYPTPDPANGLVTITAPGATGVNRVSTITLAVGRATQIKDPDNLSTSFGYDASVVQRLVTRTDRRATLTTYTYGVAQKVTGGTTTMGSGQQNIAVALLPQEIRGLTGTYPATDTLRAYTFYDGPRLASDVADTAAFWVDQLGEPMRIADALGDVTVLTRTDSRWPARVTMVTRPYGWKVTSTYDTRGNLATTTDSGFTGNPTTNYTWDQTWDAVTKIVRPEGDSARMGYDAATGNRLWQEDGRGSTSRITFGYNATNQVSSITRPGTPAEQVLYDATYGNVDSVVSPKGFDTRTISDAMGRVTQVLTRTDTLISAPPASRLYSIETLQLDVLGRDTLDISSGPAISIPGGGTVPAESMFVRKFYNPNGQVDSLWRWSRPKTTSVDTIRTRWRFDPAGRQVKEIAPDNMRDSTSYDPAGNPVQRITRRNDTTYTGYDALNRPMRRILSQHSYSSRTSGIHIFAQPAVLDYPAYIVPVEADTFSYDSLGRLLSANNGDARVKRTYFLNGWLQTDSSWIQTEARDSWNAHVYGLSYAYDRDGRRTAASIPTQLAASGATTLTYSYDPQLGALSSVYDLQGGRYDLFYNNRAEMDSVRFPGQYKEGLTYDTDGRLAADTVLNTATGAAATAYPRFPAATVRSTAYRYDAQGRLLWSGDPLQWQDTLQEVYSGLGHVYRSQFSQHARVIGCTQLGCSNSPTRFVTVEIFKTDALANRAQAVTVDSSTSPPASGSDSSAAGSAYGATTGRLATDTLTGGVRYHYYDNAGNEEFVSNLGGPAEERASFFATDGSLRAVDWRRAQGPFAATGSWQLAFEEYRYDALGRRVWARSKKICGNITSGDMTIMTECQTSIVRRTIWDGSQELVEIQMPYGIQSPGSSTINTTPTYWENDTQPVNVGTELGGGDPQPYFGHVVYAHGSGMDRPLAITRVNYGMLRDLIHRNTINVVRAPFTIVPFWNARGDAPIGVFSTGDFYLCTSRTSDSLCAGVVWPWRWSSFDHQQGTTRDTWHGTLLEGKLDKSGLNYMRNRSYDPSTGRFTQEDPLGLGGGLNLYGFAGGDPVNFADPFGTCDRIKDTTAPCELFLAVYAEASSSASEQSGVAFAIINRANDSKHKYGCKRAGTGCIKNSGNLEADVAAQASNFEIDANRESAYIHTRRGLEISKEREAANHIYGDAPIRAEQQGEWDSVVRETEDAYTGASEDPTGGATAWGAGATPTMSKSCAQAVTATVGSTTFFKCSQ